MEKWIIELLRNMVSSHGYLRSFHTAYRSQINNPSQINGEDKIYPLLMYALSWDTSRIEKKPNGYFHVLPIMLDFARTKNQTNENYETDAELSIIDHYAELTAVAIDFLNKLRDISCSNNCGVPFIVSDENVSLSRGEYKNNNMAVVVSLSVTIHFSIDICGCGDCCFGDICIPPMQLPNPCSALVVSNT